MRKTLKLLVFLGLAGTIFCSAILASEDNCLTCHSDWEDEQNSPSLLWKLDIHQEVGLSCSDCHGGDQSLDDMDDVRDSRGYRGVPETVDIPRFCGRCHSDAEYMKKFNPSVAVDQLTKYKTSVHGKRLAKGDTKAATCISCHSVHNIGAVSSPNSSVYPLNLPGTCSGCHSDAEHMSGYDIPTDQFEKYAASVHGIALLEREDIGAPSCNDCHGNHGASPPGVDNISAVCGMCHAKQAMLFAESPHKKAYEKRKLPQCETCHSNHYIEVPHDDMVGVGLDAFCSDCHNKTDNNKGFETAAIMSNLIDSLVKSEERAAAIIAEAELKGMLVDDEHFALQDVRSSLIEARTLVHSFSLEKIEAELDKGITLANATHARGEEILDEYNFRRAGLGVATIIITFLAYFLWRKIKESEDQT